MERLSMAPRVSNLRFSLEPLPKHLALTLNSEAKSISARFCVVPTVPRARATAGSVIQLTMVTTVQGSLLMNELAGSEVGVGDGALGICGPELLQP